MRFHEVKLPQIYRKLWAQAAAPQNSASWLSISLQITCSVMA